MEATLLYPGVARNNSAVAAYLGVADSAMLIAMTPPAMVAMAIHSHWLRRKSRYRRKSINPHPFQ
jgi:hypothetical protein